MAEPIRSPTTGPRRLHWFMAGMLCGAALSSTVVYQTLCYHFLHTRDGFVRLPKARPTFSEAYLDIRNYGPDDWGRHNGLVAAILRADRFDLLQSPEPDSQKARLNALMQSLKSAEPPAELFDTPNQGLSLPSLEAGGDPLPSEPGEPAKSPVDPGRQPPERQERENE